MSSQPSLKFYVSSGTQTDLTLLHQPSCTCSASQFTEGDSEVNDDPASPGQGSPSEYSDGRLDSSILACEDAYTQYSRTSDMPKRDPSRQKAKPTSIGYSRPLGDLTTSRRVVSLPTNTLQAETVLAERKMRIVSMPEVGNGSTLMPHAMQTTSSAASDKSRNSPRKGSTIHMRTYPSDLPRTPSPPSSPDSVVIVGNGSTQVSTSFLRRSYTDDDGWITWASSPPRPIPALHGPLSLPYARCPSGAEGTLVEGDDLPHKIWGLGIDDAQGNSRSANRVVGLPSQPLQPAGPSSNCTPAFDANIQFERPQNAKTMTLHSHRDAVIDLSKPSTFHSCVDESGVHLRAYSPTTCTGMCLSDTARRRTLSLPPSAAVVDLDLPGVWQPDRPQSKSSLEYYVSQSPGTGYARGLEAYANDSNQSQLNRSAPLFIPGSIRTDERWKRAYIQTPEEHKKINSSRNSTFSRTTRAKQEHPASPSTCSPGWSPVFPGNLIEFSRQRSSKPTLAGSQYRDPDVFSPHLDIDEHSSRLLAMIQQVGDQDFDSKLKSYPGDLREFVDPYLSSNSPIDRYDKEQIETYASPRLSNHTHKFSYQPRSVPLARLIQRRLSVVTEEGVSRQGPAPLLPKSDRYLESKEPEAIVLTKDMVSNAAETDLDMEPAQNTVSVEAIHDDRAPDAVVKLPRRR